MFPRPKNTGKTPSRLGPDGWSAWTAAWWGFVLALLFAVGTSHVLSVTHVASSWLGEVRLALSEGFPSGACDVLSDSEIGSADPLSDLMDEEVEDAWVVLPGAGLHEQSWFSERFEIFLANRPDDVAGEARLKPKVFRRFDARLESGAV